MRAAGGDVDRQAAALYPLSASLHLDGSVGTNLIL